MVLKLHFNTLEISLYTSALILRKFPKLPLKNLGERRRKRRVFKPKIKYEPLSYLTIKQICTIKYRMQNLPIKKYRLPEIQVPWDRIDELFKKALVIEIESGNALSTVTVDERLDTEEWFKPVRDRILEITRELAPFIDTTCPWTDLVHGAWVNRHYKGGQTLAHWHERCDLVFSCYLKVPENSGGFTAYYQGEWHTVPVTTGDMLVFPGELGHETEASKSDDARLVMTVNVSKTASMFHQIAARQELFAVTKDKDYAIWKSHRDQTIAHGNYIEQQQRLFQRLLSPYPREARPR